MYQQSQRWLQVGSFESKACDLRSIIRVARGRQEHPSAVILDGSTTKSNCESGPRAGYDAYKRKRGSKAHIAVDTLGQLLAVHVTPANQRERVQVPETLAGLHFVVFTMLMLAHTVAYSKVPDTL